MNCDPSQYGLRYCGPLRAEDPLPDWVEIFKRRPDLAPEDYYEAGERAKANPFFALPDKERREKGLARKFYEDGELMVEPPSSPWPRVEGQVSQVREVQKPIRKARRESGKRAHFTGLKHTNPDP